VATLSCCGGLLFQSPWWVRIGSRTGIDWCVVYEYYAALFPCKELTKPRRGGRNGGVIMKSPTSEVALTERAGVSTTYADKEASPQRAEVPREEKQAAEKPKASEEIVIEEISIDGMCGVY
jgi:mycofactocin precursor